MLLCQQPSLLPQPTKSLLGAGSEIWAHSGECNEENPERLRWQQGVHPHSHCGHRAQNCPVGWTRGLQMVFPKEEMARLAEVRAGQKSRTCEVNRGPGSAWSPLCGAVLGKCQQQLRHEASCLRCFHCPSRWAPAEEGFLLELLLIFTRQDLATQHSACRTFWYRWQVMTRHVALAQCLQAWVIHGRLGRCSLVKFLVSQLVFYHYINSVC